MAKCPFALPCVVLVDFDFFNLSYVVYNFVLRLIIKNTPYALLCLGSGEFQILNPYHYVSQANHKKASKIFTSSLLNFALCFAV